jgi:hypothetical protein
MTVLLKEQVVNAANGNSRGAIQRHIWGRIGRCAQQHELGQDKGTFISHCPVFAGDAAPSAAPASKRPRTEEAAAGPGAEGSGSSGSSSDDSSSDDSSSGSGSDSDSDSSSSGSASSEAPQKNKQPLAKVCVSRKYAVDLLPQCKCRDMCCSAG